MSWSKLLDAAVSKADLAAAVEAMEINPYTTPEGAEQAAAQIAAAKAAVVPLAACLPGDTVHVTLSGHVNDGVQASSPSSVTVNVRN